MDAKTLEMISTPVPNKLCEGRWVFTCSEVGCKNRLTMPGEWKGEEVRRAFSKEGWIHLLEDNFCAEHALKAVAAELNLRLHRERGLDGEVPVGGGGEVPAGGDGAESCRG